MILLLRTAHYNLAALRDVYLHTNTLAALANLAPYARSLSSLAAQRLVSLFDMLARRCAAPQPFTKTAQLHRTWRPARAASLFARVAMLVCQEASDKAVTTSLKRSSWGSTQSGGGMSRSGLFSALHFWHAVLGNPL